MPLTPLIGREQDLQATCTRLLRPEVRLLTLIGTIGVGKTRLAIELGTRVQETFAQGVCFVSLAPISEPELVAPAIAHALGVHEDGIRPIFGLVKTFLHEKQLLLLDNFEQLLQAAPLLEELLAACPQIKLLVTSRAVLHVKDEYEFTVQPLAIPDLQALPAYDSLSQVAAVELFVQRVEAIEPGFQLTEHNATSIANICVRLGGVPLAIELAAARSKLFSPQALLSRLEHSLEVLSGGRRDAPSRQQTLRDAINWSYDLLTAEEQTLFRRLCVFVGGFTLEAAEAISTELDGLPTSVLEGVASLLDHNLLYQYEKEGSESRLSLLEIIREYGLERLAESGELEHYRDAHAAYYLRLSEQAGVALPGPVQLAWVKRLEQEHENIRAALQWLLARHETETVLRIASALRLYWIASRRLSEGREFLEQALEAASRDEQLGGSRVLARALDAAGYLANEQYDPRQAAFYYEASLGLFRRLQDQQGIADALYGRGTSIYMLGKVTEGLANIEEALARYRELGDTRNCYARARRLSEESLALFRMLGVPMFALKAMTIHAYELMVLGEETSARARLEEVLALAQERENIEDLARMLGGLGHLALRQGRLAEARAWFEKSITKMQGRWLVAPTKWIVAVCLEGLAATVLAEGQAERAVQLCAAARTVRAANGHYTPFSIELPVYEHILAEARSKLGEKTFAAAWAAGLTMTPQQALGAETRRPPTQHTTQDAIESPAKPQPVPPPVSVAGLTRREIEVLRLVAQSMSNSQIAKQLALSLNTIRAYTQSIYRKLDINSRSAATRFAMEHHLLQETQGGPL
ncbi:MAG TPA: LuxR C-terminal-related transcriptional regulator [Ktedonobacteraceae bacterium]